RIKAAREPGGIPLTGGAPAEQLTPAPSGSRPMSHHVRVLVAHLILVVACAMHAGAQSAAAPPVRLSLPAEAELRAAVNQLLQPPANPKPPTPQELGEQFDALLARYKPADFDPVDRARELPNGIEPAFNEVRDRVRFESYTG